MRSYISNTSKGPIVSTSYTCIIASQRATWRSFIVLLAFIANAFGPIPVAPADEFRLPAPGVMVHLSPPLDPPILKGIRVHPDNPFRFDFILDKGDSQLSNDALKIESSNLIKYFLVSLTIPEKDLWVNLSPYEKDRIIPQSFGLTEMGRDLLAEDYMLKQITASLIYPEGEVGKKFWKRVYEEAARRYGTTNVPVNTFNKVWIVPEKAVVYENPKVGAAYVIKSTLKVMLEEDYLSLEKHEGIQSKLAHVKDVNQLGSQIVREIVIPQLTKEVNTDKNFARLRQVYNSLILAIWYKKKIRDSILEQVYFDKNKISGVNIIDSNEQENIYQRYLRAFKKGVYNYIKENIDPISQEFVPRKYFSGGIPFSIAYHILQITGSRMAVSKVDAKKYFIEKVRLDALGQGHQYLLHRNRTDFAMSNQLQDASIRIAIQTIEGMLQQPGGWKNILQAVTNHEVEQHLRNMNGGKDPLIGEHIDVRLLTVHEKVEILAMRLGCSFEEAHKIALAFEERFRIWLLGGGEGAGIALSLQGSQAAVQQEQSRAVSGHEVITELEVETESEPLHIVRIERVWDGNKNEVRCLVAVHPSEEAHGTRHEPGYYNFSGFLRVYFDDVFRYPQFESFLRDYGNLLTSIAITVDLHERERRINVLLERYIKPVIENMNMQRRLHRFMTSQERLELAEAIFLGINRQEVLDVFEQEIRKTRSKRASERSAREESDRQPMEMRLPYDRGMAVELNKKGGLGIDESNFERQDEAIRSNKIGQKDTSGQISSIVEEAVGMQPALERFERDYALNSQMTRRKFITGLAVGLTGSLLPGLSMAKGQVITKKTFENILTKKRIPFHFYGDKEWADYLKSNGVPRPTVIGLTIPKKQDDGTYLPRIGFYGAQEKIKTEVMAHETLHALHAYHHTNYAGVILGLYQMKLALIADGNKKALGLFYELEHLLQKYNNEASIIEDVLTGHLNRVQAQNELRIMQKRKTFFTKLDINFGSQQEIMNERSEDIMIDEAFRIANNPQNNERLKSLAYYSQYLQHHRYISISSLTGLFAGSLNFLTMSNNQLRKEQKFYQDGPPSVATETFAWLYGKFFEHNDPNYGPKSSYRSSTVERIKEVADELSRLIPTLPRTRQVFTGHLKQYGAPIPQQLQDFAQTASDNLHVDGAMTAEQFSASARREIRMVALVYKELKARDLGLDLTHLNLERLKSIVDTVCKASLLKTEKENPGYSRALKQFLTTDQIQEYIETFGTFDAKDLILILQRTHSLLDQIALFGVQKEILGKEFRLAEFIQSFPVNNSLTYRIIEKAGFSGREWDQIQPDPQTRQLLKEGKGHEVQLSLEERVTVKNGLPIIKAIFAFYRINRFEIEGENLKGLIFPLQYEAGIERLDPDDQELIVHQFAHEYVRSLMNDIDNILIIVDIVGRHSGRVVDRFIGRGADGMVLHTAGEAGGAWAIKINMPANGLSATDLQKNLVAITGKTKNHPGFAVNYDIFANKLVTEMPDRPDQVEEIVVETNEFIEGENLRDVISQKGPRQNLEFLRQFVDMHRFLESIGYYNRDAQNLTNIIVDRKNQCKLVDYGNVLTLAQYVQFLKERMGISNSNEQDALINYERSFILAAIRIITGVRMNTIGSNENEEVSVFDDYIKERFKASQISRAKEIIRYLIKAWNDPSIDIAYFFQHLQDLAQTSSVHQNFGISQVMTLQKARNGGIDLTPANLHVETQNSGDEIKFHMDAAMLQQLQNAPGFEPVIISIQPMTDLRQFLGLNIKQSTIAAG